MRRQGGDPLGQLLVRGHLLADQIQDHRQRHVERRADGGEQLAGRLLLPSLDLREVAEADPRGLRDLTQGLGLGHPLLAQRLTDELTDEHLLRRGSKTHAETVPSRTHTPPADRALSTCRAAWRPALRAARSGDGGQRQRSRPGSRRGPRPGTASRTCTGRSPADPSDESSGSGPATATNTCPTGWPSCGSGPATPVVASPQSAPHVRAAPRASCAAVVGRHRPVGSQHCGRHPGQLGLEIRRVRDQSAAVDDGRPGHRGDRGADQATGQRLGSGHGLRPVPQREHDRRRQVSRPRNRPRRSS